jgi:phytoene synthase
MMEPHSAGGRTIVRVDPLLWRSRAWEVALVNKALSVPAEYLEPYPVDSAALRAAYAHCERITQAHSRTFYLVSAFMSRPKRQAIRALYAFCRMSDDLVDCADGDRATKLAAWRRAICDEKVSDPVLHAWRDTLSRYRIPLGYMGQLLDALATDLTATRYPTFELLAHYCYGVASTVGLMSMHIIGFKDERAVEYAVRLGVALQLTNILRDVGEDWRRGRLYLPLDELQAFGLSESDIESERVSEQWRAFMRFQIARARALYAESLPGLALLERDGRFAVAAAAELYGAILDDIEAHDYDVFRRRAQVSTSRKLIRLPAIAWRVYTNRYSLSV